MADEEVAGITSVISYLRGLSWLSRSVAGQHLEGLADEVNCTFRIPFAPVSEEPAPIFYTIGDDGKTALEVDTINYDYGEVVFKDAPETSPFGEYSAQAVTNAVLVNTSLMGFTEMQVRWPRQLYVYQGAISATSGSATSTIFDTSAVQNAFLNRCAEYELCRMLSTGAVFNAMSYREERMGGLMVDTTKQPKDWAALVASLQETLRVTEDAARSELGDTFGFGVFLPGPQLINGTWTDDSF